MNEIEFAEWVDWAERRALESFAGEGLGGQLLGKPADFVMLHLPDRTLIRRRQSLTGGSAAAASRSCAWFRNPS